MYCYNLWLDVIWVFSSDMMMKQIEVGEAPYIRPVRSWEEEELMTGAPRLGKDLKKSSTLNSVEEISGVGMM